MTDAASLNQFIKHEPWYRRIVYALLALLAVLYLLGQIAMVVLWLSGDTQLDSL